MPKEWVWESMFAANAAGHSLLSFFCGEDWRKIRNECYLPLNLGGTEGSACLIEEQE